MEHQHHRLEKTVICADGDGSLRSEEEKCQEASRSGRGSKAGLLHRLWVSGEAYEPLRNSQKAMRAVA